MYVLWFLGNLLEPSLGPFRFAGLYFASLLTGSLAVLLDQPGRPDHRAPPAPSSG